MKHLILIAALIAAPALANSAKRAAANAEICGSAAGLAVVAALASEAALTFKEVKPAKTGDSFVDSMVIALVSDAYYGYAAMESSMVRSLSYSRCQTIMMDYR